MKQPVALIILDGWGLDKPNEGNAISLAKTPNMDRLMSEYPNIELDASGRSVGLPAEQDGNSEAGHMNIGAGRTVDQDAVKVNRAIATGAFSDNAAFVEAIDHVKKYGSKMHIMGLLANKMSAHAYPDHLYALLALMEEQKVDQIYLHLFTDGRDSYQRGATSFLRDLKKAFRNGEKIATVMGRYYAMERNKRWDITRQAYELLTEGKGLTAKDADQAIVQSYYKNENDEFIKPTLINNQGLIEDNDAIVYFNLRSDRARQLSKAFVQDEFEKKNRQSFQRQVILENIRFVAMTDFGPDLDDIITAFPSDDLEQTLPMALKDFKQLYIAESEKYAHVTYFFNGGYADLVGGEERVSVASPDCEKYSEKPAMSSKEIADVVIGNIEHHVYDFYCINFVNPDMVGHTGDLEAGIKACESVDEQLGRIVKAIEEKGGTAMITADHGNVEEMINFKTGQVDTKHSSNLVPFIITDKTIELKNDRTYTLGNIAPSVIKLMGAKKPDIMDEELW